MFKLLKILIFYWKELLKQLKMKQKNKKEDFLVLGTLLILGTLLLLGTLGDTLLWNMLAGKGFVRAGYWKGIVTAGYGNKIDF